MKSLPRNDFQIAAPTADVPVGVTGASEGVARVSLVPYLPPSAIVLVDRRISRATTLQAAPLLERLHRDREQLLERVDLRPPFRRLTQESDLPCRSWDDDAGVEPEDAHGRIRWPDRPR
jgi:hypothetical protein